MAFQALLFCPDEKLARVVSQVLQDVDFVLDPVNDPFSAVKKLMAQRYDAIVADCDNEQSISLIFKSARNSTLNQASLGIAMVEGQSGVARAYRFGANLVLTKPINIEQCKGTLRVARGLLRKTAETASSSTLQGLPRSDAAAPAGREQQAYPTAVEAPRTAIETPEFTAPAAAASTPAPSMSATAITQENPVTAPTPGWPSGQSEPAMVSDLKVGSEAKIGGTKTASETNADMRTADAKTAAATAIAAVTGASAETVRKEAVKADLPKPTTLLDAVSSMQGTAAAAAPAKTKEEIKPAELKPATKKEKEEESKQAKDVTLDEAAEKHPFSYKAVSDGPTFASFENESAEGSGGGKKILIGVVAVVALLAALYFGWSRFSQSGPSAVPQPTSAPHSAPPNAVESEPAPEPSSAASSNASAGRRSNAPSLSTPSASSPAKTNEAPVSSSPERLTVDLQPQAKKSEAAPLLVKSGAAPHKIQQQLEDTSVPPSPGEVAAPAAVDLGLAAQQPSIPKPGFTRIKVSQGVSQGLLIKRVEPVYPPAALRMHAQGAVQIEATISKDGKVVAPKVASGDKILAGAALEAVRQWRYKPYFLDGEPVEVQTQITIYFKSN